MKSLIKIPAVTPSPYWGRTQPHVLAIKCGVYTAGTRHATVPTIYLRVWWLRNLLGSALGGEEPSLAGRWSRGKQAFHHVVCTDERKQLNALLHSSLEPDVNIANTIEEASTHKSAKSHAGNVFMTRDLDVWPFNSEVHRRRQLWGTGACTPLDLQQFFQCTLTYTKSDSDYMWTVASSKHPVTFVPLLALKAASQLVTLQTRHTVNSAYSRLVADIVTKHCIFFITPTSTVQAEH